MTIKNKIFNINSQFSKDASSTDVENVFISGYASVNVPDRIGDVVPSSVWSKGMSNYLKNPVILAFHEHSEPVGRMVEHKVDERGLWIKARISSSAEEIFNKVKDGIISAFSVAFRVLDAEYNTVTELFVIKELELLEISVVSVPMNQDCLFDLSKSFNTELEFQEFKLQFAKPDSTPAKGLEESTPASGGTSKRKINMDDNIEQLVATAAAKAADEATARLLSRQEDARKAAEAEAAKAAELQSIVEKAVAARVEVGASGAEKLLEEVTKRLSAAEEASTKQIADLKAALDEKAAELAAIQKSKMTFTDNNSNELVSLEEKSTAVLLSHVLKKDINDTKFGKELREKVGQHLPSATWELEVSTNMESEVRRRLVVEPIFRKVQMKTNVMTFPLNPETGHANWVTNANFGTTNSMGGTTAGSNTGSPHLLKEVTLNAYKIASNEYLNFEEEEDSLIVLMPIVRDALVRRIARGVDKAILLGAGAGGDPVKGVSTYDTTSAVTATNTGAASIANLRSLRKDLGAWGLDPAEVVYVVSTEVYYDLLDDTAFQTMDKVGAKATLLTGQVGTIGNSPVLVSAEFPTKAGGSTSATTNYGAIAVAPGNFMVGVQRGMRFDTQDLVEYQRKVLVASLRTGMTQVTTNLGQGVSVLRWT